ncbi:MAG: flagellar motor switch protein FliN [Planctomycetota bacterium]|jgi:flagellar motor switch protein FliN/FliY
MADETPDPRADTRPPDTEAGKQTTGVDAPADGAADAPVPSAEEAIAQAARATESLQEQVGGEAPRPLDLPDLGGNGAVAGSSGLELLNDVDLAVKVELGRTKMYIEDVLHLNEHSVVELDKAAGDPVDIYVNERHVARGEVLVLDDNFCVRVTEIIAPLASDD